MKQQTFSDMEYNNRKRKTKREDFLDQMNKLIPWSQWIDLIRPFYPSGKRGRPPKEIETMLRMYLMQNWFNLSDEGIEDSIYDSYAMRSFMGIDFFSEQVPDATTLLHFRHLIEENKLGELIFNNVKVLLDQAGLIMNGGTIVDATIIEAPSSTKNKKGERDPEMHQIMKGHEWHFGMKLHAGVDAGSGFVHTITATPGNVHDIAETSKLLREDDEVIYGDSGYTGIGKRDEIKSDINFSKIEFRINQRPTRKKSIEKISYNGFDWNKYIENRKSSTRCKVEHLFLIIKKQFGYSKVTYRGITKNLNRFHILCASANLVMCARAGRKICCSQV